MNISNLGIGQIIKNYKELCTILDIKATTNGITKNKQLEELKIYCNYEKQGNKYIIKEIYKTPINPVLTIDDLLKTKNSKYIKLLANIIVEYLYNNPDEVKEVPISRLFVMLGITNTNYNSANYYRKELSQLYDIRLASIYYFYSNTRMEFKNIIERCLNNLDSRRVLNWYKVVMIKDPNTKQIYKADKETEKFIIDTEKETLQHLELNNMYELMKDRKKLREFNKIIFKETNIDYFYAYDLVIGEKALKIEYNNIQEYKESINKLIIDRTTSIFSKDKYIPFADDYKLLNDILINFANKEVILSDLQNKHTHNITDYNNSREILNEKYKKEQQELKKNYFDVYSIEDEKVIHQKHT